MNREIILYAVLAGLLYLVINSYVTISHLKVEVKTIQSSIGTYQEYIDLRNKRTVKNQENILIIKEQHKVDINKSIDLNDFIKELSEITK